MPAEAVDLVSRLLQYSPTLRFTAVSTSSLILVNNTYIHTRIPISKNLNMSLIFHLVGGLCTPFLRWVESTKRVLTKRATTASSFQLLTRRWVFRLHPLTLSAISASQLLTVGSSSCRAGWRTLRAAATAHSRTFEEANFMKPGKLSRRDWWCRNWSSSSGWQDGSDEARWMAARKSSLNGADCFVHMDACKPEMVLLIYLSCI